MGRGRDFLFRFDISTKQPRVPSGHVGFSRPITGFHGTSLGESLNYREPSSLTIYNHRGLIHGQKQTTTGAKFHNIEGICCYSHTSLYTRAVRRRYNTTHVYEDCVCDQGLSQGE